MVIIYIMGDFLNSVSPFKGAQLRFAENSGDEKRSASLSGLGAWGSLTKEKPCLGNSAL
jgi:hypothetical protein